MMENTELDNVTEEAKGSNLRRYPDIFLARLLNRTAVRFLTRERSGRKVTVERTSAVSCEIITAEYQIKHYYEPGDLKFQSL
jgi:hypothetical protein